MITLTVALKAADGTLRAGSRYDVTRSEPWDDGPNGPAKTARRYAAQRRTREHVLVTVLVDGTPTDQWNADAAWPRESIDAIARARHTLTEGAAT